MRMPRYTVSFGYMTKPKGDNVVFGNLEPKTMTHSDVEYLLKILNPFKSQSWLETIGCLTKGSHVCFEMISVEHNGMEVKKILRIAR